MPSVILGAAKKFPRNPYPASSKNYGAVGGLLYGDTPFICGDDRQYSNCYILGNSTVLSSATLLAYRYGGAAGLVIGQSKLWITGGNLRSVRTTSEFVSPGQESVKGSDLPVYLTKHCMVQLDEDTNMIVKSNYRLETNYFYSIKNDSFTEGPKLVERTRRLLVWANRG